MAEPLLLPPGTDPNAYAGLPGYGVVGPATYQVGVQTDAPTDFNDTLRRTRGWAQDDYNASVAGATDRANREAADKAMFEDMLQQSRAADAAKAVEAAQRFQALRSYNRDYQAMVAAGESPEQAAVLGAMRNPGLFAGSPSSLARVVTRQSQPPVQPPMLQQLGPGVRAVTYGPGGRNVRVLEDAPPKTPPASSLLRPMQRELSLVNDAIAEKEATGVTTNTVDNWPKWTGGGKITAQAQALQTLYKKREELEATLAASDAARGIPPLVSSGAAPAAVAPAGMAKTPTSGYTPMVWDAKQRKAVPK